MRRISALVLGCALLLPARAAAQDTARTAPPTAGQLAAARELLEVMHMEEVSAAAMKVAFDEQIRANPAMEPYRAAMTEWGRELFASEEAKAAFATLYAGAFSEADLRALVAFYRTPLGQRLATSQAELLARIQRVTPKP